MQLARVALQFLCTLMAAARRPLSPTWSPAASLGLVGASSDSNRLYEDLMMSYNRFVRPVQNDTDTLVVKLGLKLSQLIDVVSIGRGPH